MIAVRSAVHTEFADTAFLTECRAVGTGFAADITDHSTVAAVMALLTHRIGAVYTDTTVRTELIHTAGAFTAFFTDIFGTVGANDAAILTDLRTLTTLTAVFAVQIIGTFTADIA